MNDTREAMLEAGVRLYGLIAGDLLKGIAAGDVAREAGFHRQTFYRYWDTQTEFVQDLIRHLLAHRPPPTDGVAVMAERPRPGSVADLARDLAQHDFLRAVEDPKVSMRVSLLAMEALKDEPLADLAQRYYDAAFGRIAAAYDELLAEVGREPVPPYTSRDLARIVQATMLGLVLQAKAAADDPHPAVLLEVAVDRLLEAMTRPVGG